MQKLKITMFKSKKTDLTSVFSSILLIKMYLADDREYFEQVQSVLTRIDHKSVVSLFDFYKRAFNKESGLLDSLNEMQK